MLTAGRSWGDSAAPRPRSPRGCRFPVGGPGV